LAWDLLPSLLGRVLEHHLDLWSKKYPEEVERLHQSLYVDNILRAGRDVTQAKQRKATAIEIMNDAKLELHKWNSNVPELEDEQSFGKEQLCIKPSESKLLGLKWDKEADTVSVKFPPKTIASPTTLKKKLVFRDVCDTKIGWDATLPESIQKRWLKCVKSPPEWITIH
jgi:hypothetical protein